MNFPTLPHVFIPSFSLHSRQRTPVFFFSLIFTFSLLYNVPHFSRHFLSQFCPISLFLDSFSLHTVVFLIISKSWILIYEDNSRLFISIFDFSIIYFSLNIDIVIFQYIFFKFSTLIWSYSSPVFFPFLYAPQIDITYETLLGNLCRFSYQTTLANNWVLLALENGQTSYTIHSIFSLMRVNE